MNETKKEIFGDDPDIKLTPSSSKKIKVWALAGELGFTIAIPIVVLAILGRLGDKYLNTSPLLLLLGVLLSIFISSYLIYKKISEII
jgi:ATP synthase protein I